MSWTTELADLTADAFKKTTSPELIVKGTQLAYKHAGLQLDAAQVLAAAEAALQQRVSNLLAVAAGMDLPGMDSTVETQLRVEAYMEAVQLLGLAEDNEQEETGNHGND